MSFGGYFFGVVVGVFFTAFGVHLFSRRNQHAEQPIESEGESFSHVVVVYDRGNLVAYIDGRRDDSVVSLDRDKGVLTFQMDKQKKSGGPACH